MVLMSPFYNPILIKACNRQEKENSSHKMACMGPNRVFWLRFYGR